MTVAYSFELEAEETYEYAQCTVREFLLIGIILITTKNAHLKFWGANLCIKLLLNARMAFHVKSQNVLLNILVSILVVKVISAEIVKKARNTKMILLLLNSLKMTLLIQVTNL